MPTHSTHEEKPMHHLAASAPVQSHEPVTIGNDTSSYVFAQTASSEPNPVIKYHHPAIPVEGTILKPKSIPERIDRIFYRLEEDHRRMVVIEERLTLYEGKLGI